MTENIHPTGAPLQVDVVIDTMCPWCYLGKRRLEIAMDARPDINVNIRWRPYQLDASIPAEGMVRKDYLENKFGPSGTSPNRYVPVTRAGAKDGIDFQIDKIKKSPNTIDSHRLIRWAATEGCQPAILERIFELYFTEGADIGDQDVLIKAAEDVGMNVALVKELMASDADRDLVEKDIEQARSMGVSGVPCFIFENKYVISGAQETEVLISAFDQIMTEKNNPETVDSAE